MNFRVYQLYKKLTASLTFLFGCKVVDEICLDLKSVCEFLENRNIFIICRLHL